MRGIILLPAVAALFTMCSQPTWTKKDNMVIVNLRQAADGSTRKIKLEAVTDEIIHVVASPDQDFSQVKSLCVNEIVPETTDFSVEQDNEMVVLKTGRIKARISLSTGQILFYDLNEKLLLREPSSGGRTFNPVVVEAIPGYSIGQIFDSPGDEAFYGLGQHQSDEFNYKGRNEDLYQYNTKVSVPFVISNRNYGILWDNYSFSKFGDPRNYSQINLFRLYNENDEAGGLTATYYANSDSGKIYVKREETFIDYENLETIKNFPDKFSMHGSTVTWTGKIEPFESGLYNFRLYYAGYTKFYINDELIVPERWRTAWNPNIWKFNKYLEKGQKYSVMLEWKPDGGVSYIGFKALSPRKQEEQGRLSLTSEMGDQIDYYFIHGDNMDEVISGYRKLTGKAPIMPKWALGFWQSRERYRSQTELLDVLKEYRRRNIPVDNIVLDWSYWPVDSWGSHEFDANYFPDPEGMVREVHEMNARIMISVWPKFYHTTGHYREFDSKGWMYTRAVNDSVKDWIGKGYIGSFYDPYNQGARDLFWNQIKEHLYTKGFDAWWMDATEPDILSNASMDYRKQLSTPTALGPSTKYFNTYALMNSRAIFEGQKAADPNRRVFLLTRSGFAGLQRYSTATWSGDIGSRWEDMKAQIPAGLNFSLSGIPYWTFDIGGFCVENRYTGAQEGSEDLEEWRELNARWFQFGSFCPLFRSHGQYPYREIFNISPENHPAYKSMVYYDNLRYRFMPYIYSLAALTYFNDYTIMRAMVMDFGDDRNVINIGDQYMFGPSLMIAPVYTYKARSREVYFPNSVGWFDLYTGHYIDGGHNLPFDAPYEHIPVFVKEGSIIPVGPAIQYTCEKPGDPVTLFIYTGRSCAFTLYEDEGMNYNYEKGRYSTIKFTYDNSSGQVVIGDRVGEFDGMPATRIFNFVWVDKNNPVPFDTGMKPHESVTYTGRKLVIPRAD